MNPRLLVVSGPLKDSLFVLSGDEVPVGRDSSNVVAVSDLSLSRRHCVIGRDGDGYVIRDLESRNGTFVNGVAVREGRLQHGDRISVGDSAFILLLRDDPEEAAGAKVDFEDGPARATSQIRPQDVLYLQPERVLQQLPESSRLARNLNALLKISGVVHSIRDLEQLQAKILELIFEVAPAERGAILLENRGNGQFGSIFARVRLSVTTQPLPISRTITRQVLEQGVAILSADVAASGGLNKVESLAASNVRSLLCVPLTVFQKVTGCIYLDTTNPASFFAEEHLQLVAAIAGISALALENSSRLQWLEQENARLNTEISSEHNIVGESTRMKDVCHLLARLAPGESTVLIEGESGTGKELAARALHRYSPRSSKPFVAINCAAIPEGLLESELFGHERGAFTDAVALKKGRFEVANGGTVFLDEIGELAPSLQVKMLRVLQEREFERVGGTRPIAVDVRVIAATNKNLQDAVKAGLFRLDLFYRLNVVNVTMPPLRERREDIATLANYFVGKYCKKFNLKARLISPQAMDCLTNYDWPGNVRELENAIERALVLSVGDRIEPEDFPESVLERDPTPEIAAARYHSRIMALKKDLIVNAVSEAKGNYTEAARILGVHVNYLHRLIRNLALKESLRSLSGIRSGPGQISDARL